MIFLFSLFFLVSIIFVVVYTIYRHHNNKTNNWIDVVICLTSFILWPIIIPYIILKQLKM